MKIYHAVLQRPALRFVLAALVFGLAYTQAPLFYSNQNQYFLHGLARGGHGFLEHDWLAGTLDPTPLFSTLVAWTYRLTGVAIFHVYYLILFGIYATACLGLFVHLVGNWRAGSVSDRRGSVTTRVLAFFALLVLVHSALARWGSYRLLGWDYPWYLQAGLAGQYILGGMLQPSTFGVLLLAAIVLFVRDRPWLAVPTLALAGILHATYLLPGAMVMLGFMLALWREGKGRHALVLGAAAVLLVLPTVIYALVTFSATSAETFARAQDVLANIRIPHHTQPRLWFDAVAAAQVAWMLFAIYLVRRDSRLLIVMSTAFCAGFLLTLLQIATGSDGLALLFPWRVSAVLMPLATAIALARLVLGAGAWLDRPAVALASAPLLIGLAAAGVGLMGYHQGYQSNDNELPLLAYVREHKAEGDVYLLPVKLPNLKASTRGSLSSDFKPLAAKLGDKRIIPVDLQRFRLSTGAPIYVDFKAIPYKDTDVIEWYERMRRAQDWQTRLAEGDVPTTRKELIDHGITHVVVTADRTAPALELLHEDDAYRLYRVP